ncbi:hypothetical protein AOG2_08080 [Geobacter sp. AOG2]|nr:hypothetical protein AOG2_08080 [Geobacter sp. AOG2]
MFHSFPSAPGSGSPPERHSPDLMRLRYLQNLFDRNPCLYLQKSPLPISPAGGPECACRQERQANVCNLLYNGIRDES